MALSAGSRVNIWSSPMGEYLGMRRGDSVTADARRVHINTRLQMAELGDESLVCETLFTTTLSKTSSTESTITTTTSTPTNINTTTTGTVETNPSTGTPISSNTIPNESAASNPSTQKANTGGNNIETQATEAYKGSTSYHDATESSIASIDTESPAGSDGS